MNDTALADKVVAIGVGELYDTDQFGDGRYYSQAANYPVAAEPFVRDWRVAGALLEKAREQGFQIKFNREFVFVWTIDSDYHEVLVAQVRIDKSLPRAIIEACVEAL